jgi:predicted nucleic acid-binding Zn finger protein
MAQKMLDLAKLTEKGLNRKVNNASTQTGDFFELALCLTSTKRARLYYSEAYNDYVLSFSFGNCKKFIITKLMWKTLRKHINHIDQALSK